MQTSFSPEQLAVAAMAASEAEVRRCVHCGFCNATCPTYVLLGDELDGPRGRIYLMKDMLENERKPAPEVVKHIDRCLSCLSCMSTCPSGVNYMHLVDHARVYIEENYQRPWRQRALRALLAAILPHAGRFRFALLMANLSRPFEKLIEDKPAFKSLSAMLKLAPKRVPEKETSAVAPLESSKGRVAILQGCAEPVLRPSIRAASIRLINRMGYDVCLARGEVCCGALEHHMGREKASNQAARRNVDAWTSAIEAQGLDAILITASGCGTTIKNYGFVLRGDPAYAEKAARVSAMAKDISEWLWEKGLPPGRSNRLIVAYHAACSLQHGQQVKDTPAELLATAGYQVRTPAEAHLCCGSAGVYNILQPDIAGQLCDRKLANINRLDADVIATGNIGCATQLGVKSPIPVVHTIELLDWAAGGPAPAEISTILSKRTPQ